MIVRNDTSRRYAYEESEGCSGSGITADNVGITINSHKADNIRVPSFHNLKHS